MIDLTYQDFCSQQQAHRGTLAAIQEVSGAYSAAVEAASDGERRVWDLQSQRDLARHRVATFNSGRFDRERDHETPAAGLEEEKLASLEAALLAASSAWQEAEANVSARNQELVSLRSAQPPAARIGPALVAEHFGAVAIARDRVAHLEEVLSSLETSLAARRAEHQDRLQQAARVREDARAGILLGEFPEAPLMPGAELDELDIEDDQAARAGIARRLEQAQAELAAVEALTPPLRQAVLEQEAAAVRAEHARLAPKALKLRHRCNDLAKFARIFGVNLAYCQAPLEESVAVEDERTRLNAGWPGLFA